MENILYDLWKIDGKANYTFYYDESNNIRSFNLQEKNHEFNADYDRDFILGGVAYKESLPLNVKINVETAKELFGLQKNVVELKYKGQFKASDFLAVINKASTQKYLEWLDSSGLLIHFIRVNNLYFSLVDILDSITNPKEIEEYGFNYFKLKNVLFQTLKPHVVKLQKIFWEYKYPDIEGKRISNFLNAIVNFFPRRCEMSNEQKFIAGCMERASKDGKLVFLENNNPHVLQENFAVFYMNRVLTYPNSEHYFDEEDEVMKHVEAISFMKDHKNMHFLNSKCEIMIQLSDVFVGIMGSFATYINRHTSLELTQAFNQLNDKQKKCIVALNHLYTKSCKVDPGLVCQIVPIENIKKLEDFMKI